MDMKITWLGQAGLLFEDDEITVLIDPYLSDSVEKINPVLKRKVRVDETFFDIKPDVIICTHNHRDHTDPETLKHYLTEASSVSVLAPGAAWRTVKESFDGNANNFILFNRHTEVTIKGCLFKAVKAVHEDEHPIGVIIEKNQKKYYITGDTLYNSDIFEDIPQDIYMMFVPVNGRGNNMNMEDAQRFCDKINPEYVVPMHCGLFDSLDMNDFGCKNKIVPQFYCKIEKPGKKA